MIPVLLAALLFYFPNARQHLLSSHDAHPTVTIKQGIVVGKLLDDGKIPAPVEGFLGIRYALPPINDLRFRPAVPVPEGNGTFEAFYMGPRCPGKQMVPFLEDPLLGPDVESEDCLTINVFRPYGHDTSRAKLPVSVLIPGGAFNRGAARMHNTYTMLAHSPEPFVAVSMQYRIGVFGGLNTELTEKEGLLNLGLRDMYAALEWVQENIANFGGNPDDVTIMGLSAAAHGRRTYRQDCPSALPTLNTQHFRNFLDLTPCGHYRDLRDPDILGCLRALSSETVDRAGKDVFARSEPSVRWAWQPVLDGQIISRRPLDAWKSGNWNKVPILTGSTHNEGANYVPKTANASTDFIDFFSTLLPHLTKAELAELEALYPDPATDPTSPYADQMLAKLGAGAQYRRIEAAYGHYAYTCPVRQTAIWGSSNSPPDPPVFLYHWALNRTALLGAVHGDQMRYQTYNPEVRGISAAQDEVSGKFHAYCVSFITKGDPSAVKKGKFAAREEWTPWKDGRPSTMVLGEGNDERAGGTGKGTAAQMQDYRWGEEPCNFWWRVSERWED
ncbi:hypothetical protein EsH8_VII_000047 [Colletotrichum jinshuiense]